MNPIEIEAAAGTGRRRRARAASRAVSDINVTPFVDVMMVLLVVFMVAAPLLTVGVPLELPRSAAAPLPIDREEPLTVNIDSTGQVYLQKEPVAFEALVLRLQELAAGRSSDRVFLRADTALDYGRVAQVMGALNQGGFRNIGLVTDPAAEPGNAAR
jgi:biopolymer transport protein TolR